jgi:hypothetical protein
MSGLSARKNGYWLDESDKWISVTCDGKPCVFSEDDILANDRVNLQSPGEVGQILGNIPITFQSAARFNGV